VTAFSPVSRRMLVISGALLVAVAITLMSGVIGPVTEEFRRGATPDIAVKAFWVNIGLSLLLAVFVVVVATSSVGPRWISVSLLILSGLVVLVLGLALADAGEAYRSHGPQMATASTLLFVCAVADIFAAGLTVTAAVLRPPTS